MDCHGIINSYDELEKKLNKAMPWVGLYIAAASAICTLAMAADAINGFRLNNLRKYFSLNAASLTLLAVATKLPTDLNTIMLKSPADWFPKHISLIFTSIAIAHFTPSLGSTKDDHTLANVVALSILVVTTAADMLIQLVLLWDFLCSFRAINVLSTVLMLLSLATLLSWAIAVPSVKRSLESKYREKRKVASDDDDQRGYMIKYWVMAESGSPEFVMARSAVCTTSAAVCLLNVIVLAVLYAASFVNYRGLSFGRTESVYGRYTIWILVVQSIGVVVGAISPLFRWFIAARSRQGFRDRFKIEAYWIEALVGWRDCSSSLHIQKHKYWKFLHYAKWFAITLCIRLQIFIVLLSKLLLVLSALFLTRFSQCCTNFSTDQMGENLTDYVLLLEGEAELPKRILKNICDEANNMIEMGKKKQPQSLINLLGKFDKFQGVGGFDSDEIPSLHSDKEPPNIWMLPVVTLASIAVALPNIGKQKVDHLLSSVGEGLSLVKIVEKTLDKNAQLVSIRKSADVTWIGVVLYMKWLDVDLRRASRNCRSSKELVEKLSRKAEKAITEKDSVVENCANSMYRICRTILLSCDDELFERLRVMIADILAACLTNLPRVMTAMCHCNAIEEREKRVGEAFVLLGKTRGIVELLRRQEWPSLDHDKAADIDEWRALFRRDEDDGAASSDGDSAENSFPISIDC